MVWLIVDSHEIEWCAGGLAGLGVRMAYRAESQHYQNGDWVDENNPLAGGDVHAARCLHQGLIRYVNEWSVSHAQHDSESCREDSDRKE